MTHPSNAFLLIDTFNGRIVSRHRTEAAAEEANRRLQKAIKRTNRGAYLPTVVAAPCADGPGVRERNMSRAIGEGTHAPAHLVIGGEYQARPDLNNAARQKDKGPAA